MTTGPDEPVLPEQTRDDQDVWGGDWREQAEHEDWLERERPPHWE